MRLDKPALALSVVLSDNNGVALKTLSVVLKKILLVNRYLFNVGH